MPNTHTLTYSIPQHRPCLPRKSDGERKRPRLGAGDVVTECARGELQEGVEEGESEGGGRLECLEAAEEVKEE